MPRPLLLLLGLAFLAPASAPAQSIQRYRQWINGQELGGLEEQLSVQGETRTHLSKEWVELNRLGMNLRQDMEVRTTRRADGSMTFVWRVKLAQDPMEGEAHVEASTPSMLHLQPKGGAARDLPIPQGALLWPPDFDDQLKAAAAAGTGFTATRFSAPTQEWSTVELRHQGADPLPGHPRALRLAGWERAGRASSSVEFWVDPQQGLLKERSRLGGLEVVVQVAELPPPVGVRAGDDLFSRALKTLPPHAFMDWLPELELRQTAGEPLSTTEDAQCQTLDKGRWRLRRAAPPTGEEAAQLPVTGAPAKDEAPFLQPSPLLQFKDPRFDSLVKRLAPRPRATRWDLAKAVTHFVFEWITDKDYSVGFASALEVARTSKGDCTEHGVLAVALLRKLGVPARGAVGWVALDRTLGPHFWVEVKVKDRWIPVDPTFDEAPASAFRLKLSDTDLADLGGVGWEAAQVLGDSELEPVWAQPGIEGDRLRTPDGLQLRWPKGQWMWVSGSLALRTGFGRLELRAVPHPTPAQLQGAKLLQSGGLQGWWTPSRLLFLTLTQGRWLLVEGLEEGRAFDFLQGLQVSGR